MTLTTKSNRGGVRPGSGRPKLRHTATVRIDAELIPAVKAMSDIYRAIESKRSDILNKLNQITEVTE